MRRPTRCLPLIASIAASYALACGSVDDRSSQHRAAISGSTGGEMCAPDVTSLIAGQHTNVGEVTVDTTGTHLQIHVDTDDIWDMQEIHIYAGTEPVTTDGSRPAAGQLPYANEFTQPADAFVTDVPLDELGASCGTMLHIAVHAAVVDTGSGATETAWAYGEHAFTTSWGWSLVHDVCCDEPINAGCTLTQGYWKNHHDGAKNRALDEPWPVPEDTLLCAQTWLDILRTPPKGDAWYNLSHQYIAMRLNVASGATASSELLQDADEAADLLDQCEVPPEQRDRALQLESQFADYNEGVTGPGHCD